MFSPGDYELDRSGDLSVDPAPPRRAYGAWVAFVAAAAIAGGIWYAASRRPPSPPSAVTAPADARAAVPEAQGPLVKAADIDLPPLPQTDPVVRELVARLSSHPTIAAWLATPGLIANFTVVTLNIAEGRTPAQFLRPIVPQGRFLTISSGEEFLVDPRSYERYNPRA